MISISFARHVARLFIVVLLYLEDQLLHAIGSGHHAAAGHRTLLVQRDRKVLALFTEGEDLGVLAELRPFKPFSLEFVQLVLR